MAINASVYVFCDSQSLVLFFKNKNKTQEKTKPLVELERLNLDGFIFSHDFDPAASFAQEDISAL